MQTYANESIGPCLGNFDRHRSGGACSSGWPAPPRSPPSTGWLLPDLLAARATVAAAGLHDRPFDVVLVWVCEAALLGSRRLAVAGHRPGRPRRRPRPEPRPPRHPGAGPAPGAASPAAPRWPAAWPRRRTPPRRRGRRPRRPGRRRRRGPPPPGPGHRHHAPRPPRGPTQRDPRAARPRGPAAAHRRGPARRHVVGAGRRHPRSRTPPTSAVNDRWHRIYRANRAVIGADPDLIQPDQRLRLPRR